jgi:hypothetical protein
MDMEERARKVNRDTYFSVWGESPPGDATSVDQPPAPQPVVTDASKVADASKKETKESKDLSLARLASDVQFLHKSIESVFGTLKTSMDRLEQAQLSQRDELRALSRRLGVSMERKRAAEAAGRRKSVPRQHAGTEATKPQSFFAVSTARAGLAAGRVKALAIGTAIGLAIMLITSLAGLGSTAGGFAITGVNVLLGFGIGLLSLGILLRQRARRRTKRRGPL